MENDITCEFTQDSMNWHKDASTWVENVSTWPKKNLKIVYIPCGRNSHFLSQHNMELVTWSISISLILDTIFALSFFSIQYCHFADAKSSMNIMYTVQSAVWPAALCSSSAARCWGPPLLLAWSWYWWSPGPSFREKRHDYELKLYYPNKSTQVKNLNFITFSSHNFNKPNLKSKLILCAQP